MIADRNLCHACGAEALAAVTRIGQFVPVSSDIRLVRGRLSLAVCQACGLLQKIVDDAWRLDVRRLYDEYDINHQSGGSDPYIFNSEHGPGPRAEILAAHIARSVELPATGNMLDIGCASGNVLRHFGAAHPRWQMYGLETSDHWRDSVLRIPGVSTFVTDLRELGETKMDMILMSHVLEHIPDPVAYLLHLRSHLSEQGILYLAVPDIRQNPVDLLVLDHCTHFDVSTLRTILTSAGFDPLSVRADLLGKEIVAVNRLAGATPVASPPSSQPSSLAVLAESHIDLCEGLLVCAREQREQHPRFGLFGTSTAAAWLFGELDQRVEFFVDEDPQRVGKTAFGRPILSFEQVPAQTCVFIPMAVHTACAIMSRASRSDIALEYFAGNQFQAASGQSPSQQHSTAA